MGDLARNGRSWVLHNPREFSSVSDPEERKRSVPFFAT